MYTTLEAALSADRLATYLAAAGHDKKRAVALYAWNMRMSAAFLPLFALAEVALRNKVVVRLETNWPAKWWTNPGFLTHLDRVGQIKVARAERDLLKRGVAVTSGRMAAEMSFGFWSHLLGPHYSGVLWRTFRSDFPDMPVAFGQAHLHSRCNQIRELRNRVSHHEPIFRRNLSQDYAQIMELIRWFGPDLAVWIRPYCDAPQLLRAKP